MSVCPVGICLRHFGTDHIMDTTRMGYDPSTPVVHKSLRSRGHRHLFMMGADVFPTGGTANAALAIAVLSLRAATAIPASDWRHAR